MAKTTQKVTRTVQTFWKVKVARVCFSHPEQLRPRGVWPRRVVGERAGGRGASHGNSVGDLLRSNGSNQFFFKKIDIWEGQTTGSTVGGPKTATCTSNSNRNTSNKKSSNTQQNQEQNSTNNNPETVRAVRWGSRGGSPKKDGGPGLWGPKLGKSAAREGWGAPDCGGPNLEKVGPRRVGAPDCGGPNPEKVGPQGWRPEWWGAEGWGPKRWCPRVGCPKFRAFFFLLPLHFYSFFLSLGIFSWNFGGVLVGWDLKCGCFRPQVVL